MTNIEHELRILIIKSLNLEDITPDEIIADQPLFNDGLGLDSIDALEIGVAIKRRFHITLDGDSKEIKKHFSSIKNLALFIAEQQKKV
ncbi:acyl carrier protein [bacterium]|nr:acyl carrier protein [bacterium]